MSEFPFVYLNHGAMNADTVGSSEELFVWFERVVTAQERQQIVEACPAAVAGLFVWGDRFAYFGSGPSDFDVDIVQTYGPRDPDPDPDVSLSGVDHETRAEAVRKFNAALERWAQVAHDVAPVAFFTGPHGGEMDAWGLWSQAQLTEALEHLVAYAGERPEILAQLQHAPEADAEAEPARGDLAQEARYFSFIYGAIVCWDVQLVANPVALDLLYVTDGIWEPVSRPSLAESQLYRNGEAVSVYLARGGQPDLEAALGELAPYTQLSFLASLSARRADLPGRLTDPVGFVERLVASQPPGREAVTTSLVQMIADNGCQVGPSFDAPDKERAALGAALLTLVHDREDCPPQGFVHAALYHEWTGDHAEAVAVVEHGLARHRRHLDLARAGLAVANLGGLIAEAATFAELVAELETAPDERSILDQSYALLHSDDVEGARDALLAYHEDGGDMSADVWVNLLFTLFGTGDRDTMGRLVDQAEVALKEDPDGLASAPLLENLAYVHVVLGQEDRGLECLRRLRKLGPEDFADLRTSEVLQPLWDDPDFGALFEE